MAYDEDMAQAWERGFLYAFNTERGNPDDEPCPEYLRRDLDRWNPYRVGEPLDE